MRAWVSRADYEGEELDDFVKAAIDTYDKAVVSESDREALLASLTTRLTKYVDEHPHDDDARCLLGQCWYDRSAESEERHRAIEENLRGISPASEWYDLAMWYLGCHRFDRGDAVGAIDVLSKLDSKALGSGTHAWRALVAHEVLVCSKLAAGRDVQPEDVTSVFWEFAQLATDDFMPPPLANLLSVLIERVTRDRGAAPLARAALDTVNAWQPGVRVPSTMRPLLGKLASSVSHMRRAR